MQIVPMEPWHLTRIDPPPMDAAEAEIFSTACRRQGPAVTGLCNGTVMGCVGVIVVGDTGFAWAFLDDAVRRRPMLLHRAAVRGLRAIMRTHGLSRIEASCHARFFRAQRWLERLGFRFVEWVPDGRGTGEPYMRYVHEQT